MEEFQKFALIAALSMLATEGVVEYLLGKVFDFFAVEDRIRKLVLPLVSGAVGVGYAFHYRVDMIDLFFSVGYSWVGVVSTGVCIGRGANFISATVSTIYGWIRSKF